jgi:hypothetical protein
VLDEDELDDDDEEDEVLLAEKLINSVSSWFPVADDELTENDDPLTLH